MHVIAHSSTHAPSSASSRHCAGVSFGPARSSVAWVTSTLPVAGERLHDRVVLGRAHVAGREDRAVVAHEREHLLRLGEELAVGVGHDDARARGCRAARRRRSRSPGGCSASAATRCARRGRARPRPRPGSRRRPRGRSRCRRTPRCASPTSRCTAHASEAVGESCDFSTIARCPAAAASRAASNASTERSRCGSGPKWQCRSAAPVRSTLIGGELTRSL